MQYSVFALLVISLFIGCSKSVEQITVADDSKIMDAPDVMAGQDDWPWWRGPHLDGHAEGAAPPTVWNENENVRWTVDVPGRGHSTPSVVGDQVLVTTADATTETMTLLCFRRTDGEPMWQRELHKGGFMHAHVKNSHASATPACDGQHVFVALMVQEGVWVSAVDLNGEIVWQTNAGPFNSLHGYGSSPVLYKSLVIVGGDNKGPGFLTALDRESGQIVWRVARGDVANFGSPVIANVAGKTQLLVSGQNKVISYNPHNGEKLWESVGPAKTTVNTMNWDGDLVFASGGHPENKMMAIRADGSAEIVWENDFKVYVPSMLVVNGMLFAVQDNGVARCFEAQTGKEIWQKRLGGGFSASPVFADGNIFIPNEEGRMFVFKAADKFEKVAENDLADAGFASPVICGGELFLRSSNRLYCISQNAVVSQNDAEN